jgi:hypothetical protein
MQACFSTFNYLNNNKAWKCVLGIKYACWVSLHEILYRCDKYLQSEEWHFGLHVMTHCCSIFIQSCNTSKSFRKILQYQISYKSIILFSSSFIRRMRWAGHVARMGEKRNAYRILVGKPEGKRPLGRPRRRGVDNIKMDLREIGWDDVDWIDLAQDRDQWRAFVNTVTNLWVS